MTLEQLRIFVAVAEREHITAAAAALNLAQSAVSNAVAALEARHGTKLFHRVGRGIALNEAGALFLTEARAVLARAAAAELALSEFGGLRRGALAIHASQTIASYWLPRHLVAFRRAHPGIELRLAVGNSEQVAHSVQDGLADLGFVEGRVAAASCISRVVARDQLIVVVGMDHPWRLAPPAGRTGLAAGEWVLREPGSGTRSEFEAALGPATQLRIALELPTNEAVRAAVEAGLGAAALSASVAAPGLEAGLLHHVPIALPDRAFHVLHHKERYLSRAAQTLLDLLPAAP